MSASAAELVDLAHLAVVADRGQLEEGVAGEAGGKGDKVDDDQVGARIGGQAAGRSRRKEAHRQDRRTGQPSDVHDRAPGQDQRDDDRDQDQVAGGLDRELGDDQAGDGGRHGQRQGHDRRDGIGPATQTPTEQPPTGHAEQGDAAVQPEQQERVVGSIEERDPVEEGRRSDHEKARPRCGHGPASLLSAEPDARPDRHVLAGPEAARSRDKAAEPRVGTRRADAERSEPGRDVHEPIIRGTCSAEGQPEVMCRPGGRSGPVG
jgi:hypothetical protein